MAKDFYTDGKEKKKLNLKSVLLIISPLILLVFIIMVNKNRNSSLSNVDSEARDIQKLKYEEIAASAYDTDEDFDFYVDKFYRDANLYGLYPVRPDTTIIRFAKLDQMKSTTHIHAISYGMDDDSRIEIYINPTTWKNFKRPMRYYLMYHELSHDVLNVDDLEAIPANEGKLMYPGLSSFENKSMDEFIEAFHGLFEELGIAD